MPSKRYLNNLDSFIAACIGFYVIHLFTGYSGVGISPDSLMYASTATNIQAHGTLLTFNKHPITFFPVFYPFFLAVIQFISGVTPVKAGAVINETLFAAVIFISGWMMSKFLSPSRIYKWLVLIAIILSPGLLEIYTYLWSETLFIVEVLLFIVVYRRYLQNHALKRLLLVAAITAIACITRYVGVTIVATGGLLLLLDHELPIKKKTGHILFYGFISISLLVGNLLLNKLSTGLSTGTREPAVTSFWGNLHYFGTVICDWGALSSNTYPYAILIASVILIALISVLLFRVFKKQLYSYENIIIAFAIVYGLFLVTWASISRFEQIDSRLIAPMFVPLLIGCTSWVPDVLKLIKSKAKYVFAGVAILLMLAFEYATYQIDHQRYEDEESDCQEPGGGDGDACGVPGYTDDTWNKSAFVIYLKEHKNMFKPGVPIYTDADEVVYLFTGLSSTLLPHRFFKADVQKFYASKQFYLIWFDNLNNPELLGLPDVLKNKNMVEIGSAKKGEVYYYDEK